MSTTSSDAPAIAGALPARDPSRTESGHSVPGLGAWPAVLVDSVLATVVAILTMHWNMGWRWNRPTGLAMAITLAVSRRWPVAAFVIVIALSEIHLILSEDGWRAFDLAVPMAMFRVVSHDQRLRNGLLAGGLVLAWILVQEVSSGKIMSSNPAEPSTENLFQVGTLVGGAGVLWLAAYVTRTRRLLIESLRERAATAERERTHLNQLAIADERTVVARELHDVVAHSLAVMIVQADSAGYALPEDTQRAQTVLQTISCVGRDALQDMHRIVDVLRSSLGETGELVEGMRRVSLDELHPMADRARDAGMQVDLRLEAPPFPLSAGEELTIVRVVQESLTNSLRHAGPHASVHVQLHFADGNGFIEILDDGGPTRHKTAVHRHDNGTAEDRRGAGLAGMQERVNALGGTLKTGPRPDSGWALKAVLPLKGEQ